MPTYWAGKSAMLLINNSIRIIRNQTSVDSKTTPEDTAAPCRWISHQWQYGANA